MSGGASRQGGPTTAHDRHTSAHERRAIPLADCLPASVDSLSIFGQALTR